MDDCGNNSGSWDWQGDEYCLQKGTDLEISECLWNGVSQNDLSYVFDETTPVKDCGDLAHHVEYGDDKSKKGEESSGTHPQVKRRRMLQFNTQDMNTSLCSEETSSRFLKSNNKDVSSAAAPFLEVSYEISDCSGFPDNVPISCYENLDHSPEGWIAECLNDADMHCSPEDLSFAGASDIQIDVSEFCDPPPDFKAISVQHHSVRTSRNIIFKGRKSYIRTPTKLASSVAYPFAFIKPCGFHGDVTLKDINQRIRAPPPSKPKQNPEDLAESFPTSAFTGKPVVGKTKIHTEGGKGSITIMRTRG